jgi:hypothetical protein
MKPRPRKKEPSMGVIRRLATVNPDQLVKDIFRLRAERDALQNALLVKLADFLRHIKLTKQDIVVLRKLRKMDEQLTAEVLTGLVDKLRQRYGWEGVIILEDAKDDVSLLTDEQARELLAILKERLDA